MGLKNMKGTPSQGFPLATLFLIVSLCAILTAHLTPLLRDVVVTADLAVWTLVSALFGMMLGALVGCYHYRVGRGIIWGIGIGLVVGTFCGPIGLVSTQRPQHTLVISAVGAAILMAIAVGYRIMNNRDPSTRGDLFQRMLRAYGQD